MSNNKVTYFGGLNELRAIAALAVIFHHIELYCYRDKLNSLFNVPFFNYFISSLGKNGVYLFFVLSGFLITTLLIREKNNFKEINIPKFYLRRIFRIWPVYFIVVIFSVFFLKYIVLSNVGFFVQEKYYLSLIQKEVIGTNSLLYILFLSNFAKPIVGASQSWSVSVEEQFYLIWPHIINKGKRKLLPMIFIVIILISLVCKILELKLLNNIFTHFPIEFMALGGIFGYYWYHYREKVLFLFENSIIFILFIVFLIISLFAPMPPFIYGILFGFLILFVITEKKINLRSRFLNWIGAISYGVYMYHPLMMFLSSAIAHNMHFYNDIYIYKLLVYIFTFSLTILVSFLSYSFIEYKLIKYKDRRFNIHQ